MNLNEIRQITVKVTQEGVADATRGLNTLGDAYTTVGTKAGAVASVTDTQSKRALSAEAAYKRQTLAVVEGARAQDTMARQTKIVDSALQQGIISASDHAARVALLQEKYLGAGASAKALGSEVGGLSGAFGIATQAIGAFGLVLTAEKFIEFAKGAIDAARNAKDLGEALNSSAQFVLAFETNAAKLGIEVPAADKALQKLNQTVGIAVQGNDAAVKVFRDLGVSVGSLTTASGTLKSLPEILGMVADGFQRLKGSGHDGTDAVELFGKSGQRLLPIMREGSEGVRELADAQAQFGSASQRNVESAAALGAAFEGMAAKTKNASIDFIGWVARLFNFGAAADILPPKIQKLELEIATLQAQKKDDGFLSWLAGDSGQAALSKQIDKDIVKLADLRKALKDTQDQASGGGASVLNVSGLASATATMQDAAQRTGLSKADQLYETNVISLTKSLGIQAESFVDAEAKLGKFKDQVNATARSTADLTTRNLEAAKAQKNLVGKSGDFDKYLSGLNQAAISAGETTAQLQDQAAIIKGAQELQKSQGVTQDHLVQTYAAGLVLLTKASEIRGTDFVGQILGEKSQERLNTLMGQAVVQQALIDVASGSDADHRALAVKNMQDMIAVGGSINANGQLEIHLTDAATDAIKRKNAAAAAGTDSAAFTDYMKNLRDEVTLAGLSTDEREKQSAILQAIHLNGGAISQDMRNQVSAQIELRQETERWRQLVEGLGTPLEELPTDFLAAVHIEIEHSLQEITA